MRPSEFSLPSGQPAPRAMLTLRLKPTSQVTKTPAAERTTWRTGEGRDCAEDPPHPRPHLRPRPHTPDSGRREARAHRGSGRVAIALLETRSLGRTGALPERGAAAGSAWPPGPWRRSASSACCWQRHPGGRSRLQEKNSGLASRRRTSCRGWHPADGKRVHGGRAEQGIWDRVSRGLGSAGPGLRAQAAGVMKTVWRRSPWPWSELAVYSRAISTGKSGSGGGTRLWPP